MQSLDVISVNIWQILISLCNLALIFFIIKKFLYKPVKRVLSERQNAIDSEYEIAEKTKTEAENKRAAYEEKLRSADSEADAIIKKASASAERLSERKISDAKEQAQALIKNAQAQAELERKKAQSAMKKEIAEASSLLTEKLLGREINADDHRDIIDSVISKIGEKDD